jgi:predicted RNA-binding Zn ribbon-like protein
MMQWHFGDERPEDRDGFRFRGGHVALDLAATLGGRLKDQPRELLETPADLDRWLVSSGLANHPPGVSADDLKLARELREAIYGIASVKGGPTERERLNEIAALPAARPQLDPSGDLVREGDARSLLATIARQAVELFGGPTKSRIRTCEGESCAILFLDLSRSGGRRWCSMSGCGNRAKARAFRKRGRTEQGLSYS